MDLEAELARRRCEVRERDLVVVRIGPGAAEIGGRALDPGDGPALRERFRAPVEEPLVVVVGKDGGAKQRGPQLTLDAVFAAIDRMPMRRAEVRERGRSCGD